MVFWFFWSLPEWKKRILKPFHLTHHLNLFMSLLISKLFCTMGEGGSPLTLPPPSPTGTKWIHYVPVREGGVASGTKWINYVPLTTPPPPINHIMYLTDGCWFLISCVILHYAPVVGWGEQVHNVDYNPVKTVWGGVNRESRERAREKEEMFTPQESRWHWH
jgi:hypothetical protein